ncbi:uncharacterized protein LOC119606282 [Lucilia sericata]|uniref:uncharacterized protein LOC119606282 n=1 Tax=Lucilia sericata TaxID=13632 RepID=UPI0018A80593|nr:uncharacterized protein LOC119606282 [Lucilia sericata]XP_037815654.1 uncharacterized protein LOC119606282 [Lucilia sericata]
MNLHNPAFVLGLFTVWLSLMDFTMSFPALVMPRLHRSVEAELETNNKNMGFPQTDDDVLQLEQLREVHNDEMGNFNHQKKDELVADEVVPLAVQDSLPELEQQLESAKPDVQSTQGPVQVGVENVGETPEVPASEPKGMGAHRPPTLQINDGGKVENNGDKPKAKCRLGGMHGAARLVYGQNPEVLPTTTASTTTSTTTTTTTTTPAPEANSAGSAEDETDDDEDDSDDGGNEDEKSSDTVDEAVEAPVEGPSENQTPPEGGEVPQEVPEAPENQELPEETPVTPAPAPPQLHPMRPIKSNKKTNKEEEPERQLIGDVIVDESALRKSAARRSVAHMTPKTAESLLRHGNGQYSSFDMAQYVFWTGDEAGVARAVEELIQQDLMTREDALKFLHEIRVGIEYLQKSYANRIFPEEIRHNTIKKSYIPQTLPTTTTTTSTTTTTVKPTLPYLNLEQNVDTDSINLAKTLDSISLWHKLQAMNNAEGRQDITEYESETRRPKITDCQHKEYNLEEIIYKLARIMFTESLAHGDEAQREIQKLMDFFEREHELGIIPLDLEQKVIHVLLQALSDTLTEKPELWPAAQYPYNRLLRSYAHMNYARPSPSNV